MTKYKVKVKNIKVEREYIEFETDNSYLHISQQLQNEINERVAPFIDYDYEIEKLEDVMK